MHSLRTTITMLTVWVAVLAVVVVTLLSVAFIRNTEQRESDQLLMLLCETGVKNLNYYFNSVEKSVRRVSSFAERDLEGLDDEKLASHVERVRTYFDEMAHKTNGVLTYYYRLDPAVSDKVTGFWYTNLTGDGFEEHVVTDITQYDTSDTSRLVWFTVPKFTGQPIWLTPYITDNLNVRVISYNIPISWRGQFVGVIGIELDYSGMADQVESIELYKNGYAFLTDAELNLIFHPRIDVTKLTEETRPKTPDGLLSSNTFLSYSFEGKEKRAAWMRLANGMRLNVTVPVEETDGDWLHLIQEVMIVSAVVLVLLTVFTLYFTGRITKPLRQLTEAAAQVDQGNYDIQLDYEKDDEVGRLTKTFRRLVSHMKEQVTDLNKRAYVDALTSVRNKGAYAAYIEELQNRIDQKTERVAFAVGVFDCDDLKLVNDRYGHDKGDLYLKTASRLICRIFQHSPVFRIGGDEFSVIMQGEDYENRGPLEARFREEAARISAAAENPWEKVHVAMGIAVYNPEQDGAVIDTVRRADKSMYADKRAGKEHRQA